ncbi:MAG TPA: hypothetical protein VFB45_10665 [Pseudolabrys sp.]|nr:hypothetical protein [Pseudolabrys sp.]
MLWAGGPLNAAEPDTAALLAEVRQSFTLNGKVIPPEIFGDFGDANLADSGNIWVTVDLAAAIDSNLYFDPMRKNGSWQVQRRQRLKTDTPEETAYLFCGATANGMLVVLATYNGGGSGTFYTLHLLDVAAATAFDDDGKRYQRINLTVLRSVILGDRWEGDVNLSGNDVTVTTTRSGPGSDGGPRPPRIIKAERP